MTAIGKGSEDGIHLFCPFDELFRDDAAVQHILKSRWPRNVDEESSEESGWSWSDFDEDDDE
jgi:hypothetical protein